MPSLQPGKGGAFGQSYPAEDSKLAKRQWAKGSGAGAVPQVPCRAVLVCIDVEPLVQPPRPTAAGRRPPPPPACRARHRCDALLPRHPSPPLQGHARNKDKLVSLLEEGRLGYEDYDEVRRGDGQQAMRWRWVVASWGTKNRRPKKGGWGLRAVTRRGGRVGCGSVGA